MEGIIAAGITSLFGLIGIIFSNAAANKKIEIQLATAQEVTQNELKHLTEEVRKHNNFAERIPTMETELKDVERRVTRLEK